MGKQTFFTLEDIKNHLLDELGFEWNGKISHFQKGEITATIEDIAYLNISHLSGEYIDLPVTITNDKFIIWRHIFSTENADTIITSTDLSTSWQERLLKNNGHEYYKYILKNKKQADKKANTFLGIDDIRRSAISNKEIKKFREQAKQNEPDASKKVCPDMSIEEVIDLGLESSDEHKLASDETREL